MKKKVIIFFSIGIGDALMTTPALQSLQLLRSEYQIDALFMNKSVCDLFLKCGYFDTVHLINFLGSNKLASLKKLWKLRRENYTKSFMIFPANHYLYQVVTFMLGAKERFGHRYISGTFPDFQFLYNRNIPEDRSLHNAEENYRLFEYGFQTKLEQKFDMHVPVSESEIDFALKFLKQNNLTTKTLVGIHAGCDVLKNMIHKRWDLQKFGELIRKINLVYPDTYFLIFGGSAEYELNRKIASYLPEKTLAVEKTSFLESAALISFTKLFIANDSGLMHTAAALKIPVLAIFGPTNPVYLRPYHAEHELVKKDFTCQPCFEYARRPLICTQKDKYKCIKQLSVDEVYEKFIKLFNKVNLKH